MNQMKRLVKLFILSLFFVFSANAQEVISTSGDFHSASTGSITWTIGEVLTETYATGLNYLTQGFNQSQLSATAIEELPGLDLLIEAFPNPTSDYLILQTDQIYPCEYQVFNLLGELVTEGKMIDRQTKIDFRDFVPATYILKIREKDLAIKQFKIVKH